MTTENPIYRFKFSDEFIIELNSFSKLYQYFDRPSYKEQWTRWVNNNNEIITQESDRLTTNGYKGNILDKMYKSGRYYFRNKKNSNQQQGEGQGQGQGQEPKKRRPYISLDRELIESMDNHISTVIGVQPSLSYEEFCESNTDSMNQEMARLIIDGLNKDYIKAKFKKTYKNRYFLLRKT